MSIEITRRQFLKASCALVAAGATNKLLHKLLKDEEAFAKIGYSKEASHYKKIDGETVMCLLCPHQCMLRSGQRGFCKAREPNDGKLYTLVYESPCAVHVDPIEKKPIYHMLPASKSFSIATAGCNLRCKFCQNWQISQEYPENANSKYMSCEDVVRAAAQHNCRSIAYTYTEPIIFFEYMTDTARIAKSRGIKNVWVTAGYINQKPLEELCSVIDAANIDLKGFSDKYLEEVCGEKLEPLLATIKSARQGGMWVELTNLVIPTLNDDMAMIGDMCAWIKENVGADTPLHFSRFWPTYKLKNLPPTPTETLRAAKKTALAAGLNFVYIGNVPEEKESNTICPKCKKLIIRRAGYRILENNMTGPSCNFCNHKIPGIWS